MTRSRLRAAGGVALIVVLVAVAAGLGYVETRAARSPSAGRSAPPTAPGASPLAAASAAPSTAAPPTTTPDKATQVARALGPALSADALGPSVRAKVVDVGSGRTLLDRAASTLAAPASTAKLLTATAVLTARGPDYRIRTRAVAGRSGTLVLVGGGDPTLTGARAGSEGAYPEAARLTDLARQVRRAHLSISRIVVDDSAFAGPAVSPAWASEDVPSSYGAAITAVMTDGGRAAPGDVVRSSSPDLAAGRQLAAALGSPDLPVTRGTAPDGARTVATVRSAPVSVLVEQMLQESDNVIADCLARQVAMVEHLPVTFTGAAAAIRRVVGRLGVPVARGMVDGSGLAARDRVTVDSLAGVLRLAADAADGGTANSDATDDAEGGNEAHQGLGAMLSGLPVAAWSGTLDDRFVSGSSRGGAGVVRAKTGTLTGVSSLAGLVHDRNGRLLAFAMIADRTGPTPQAEAALDTVATQLAHCGCG